MSGVPTGLRTVRSVATATTLLPNDDILEVDTTAAGRTVTVPPDSLVPFPVGTEILVTRPTDNANLITVAAGAGVTFGPADAGSASRTFGTGKAALLRKRALNDWAIHDVATTATLAA